jgi:hypothetical protein
LTAFSIKRADLAGCGLSAACLAHCLALPVLASIAPAFGAAAEAEWVHWVFVAVAAPVAAFAFLRPRVSTTARVMAVSGLVLLVAGAAEFPSHELETPVSVAGALLLAGAHIVNALRAHQGHRPE